MLVSLLIAAVVGYLLGSLPFGYWVARAKGVNIFEVGSKSSGATNVRRVLGHGPGNLVLVLDMLKGALAASWAFLWRVVNGAGVEALRDGHSFYNYFGPDFLSMALVGLVGALVGHSFSCFTKFQGGKGVATAAGGFLVIYPVGALVAAGVWGLTLALTRYVSLSSMFAAIALTVVAGMSHQPPLILGACTAVTIFVIVRHRANISRLLNGTENKVGQPKEGSSAP
jgi:glycerol-3-phosphate acyltransferase PlsY